MGNTTPILLFRTLVSRMLSSFGYNLSLSRNPCYSTFFDYAFSLITHVTLTSATLFSLIELQELLLFVFVLFVLLLRLSHVTLPTGNAPCSLFIRLSNNNCVLSPSLFPCIGDFDNRLYSTLLHNLLFLLVALPLDDNAPFFVRVVSSSCSSPVELI